MIESKGAPFLRAHIPADHLLNTDWRDGWPSLVTVRLSTGPHVFSMFVAQITPHQRTKGSKENTVQPHEYRYQNPAAKKGAEGKGKPVIIPPGTTPLLFGAFFDAINGDVIASTDPCLQVGRTTRHQVLVDLRLIRLAQESGWAPPRIDRAEKRVDVFRADLIMLWLEASAAGVELGQGEVAPILDLVGATLQQDEAATERARRGVLALVRRRDFGRKLSELYDGRCAMCDLDLRLVVGAHIYPASAPGSPDQLWNGLALCPNHHAAYDAHQIFVDPKTREITVSPWLRERAEGDLASQRFIDDLQPKLSEPSDILHRPTKEMFEKRHDFFAESYEWAMLS